MIREEAGQLISDERLFATEDGRLVAEDDPAAATLVAAPGLPIPPKMAKRYGLKAEGKASEKAEPKAEPRAAGKEAEPKEEGEDGAAEGERPITRRKLGS